ncbi:MAG TPA: sigma-70 family RNA polymerase sigma factor [Polyangiaceae bacterium]|jgi:RNA polymerase sigma-70 factor (ECF subfamily)|nr:sigma-70 family RNA polymerase sigma factor [Polyangiaceae bacterium]
MDERNWLAQRFEAQRPRLLAVAYRMLGSHAEAEDAVQESWVRLSGADAAEIENLAGWLTTVVGRICLNALRSRATRRESSLDAAPAASLVTTDGTDPEKETLLNDAVAAALLVVLGTLEPSERLAFVLHDLFDVSFDEIAAIVGRSSAAARQLASRGRRRVRGTSVPADELGRQHAVVEAFLAASRRGDFDALVALLAPDIVLNADDAAIARGASASLRGAAAVANSSLVHRARLARVALVDGEIGVVVGPEGEVMLVLRPTVENGRLVELQIVGDPDVLRRLEVAPIPEQISGAP